tara:strand:+ start:541 stop:789 length:249 start_codon:yes stop_codon:yes gene_type:complete
LKQITDSFGRDTEIDVGDEVWVRRDWFGMPDNRACKDSYETLGVVTKLNPVRIKVRIGEKEQNYGQYSIRKKGDNRIGKWGN